ncbi:hypothetical protein BG011_006101 [Mortierella polycephala]|uniref:Uncharacterized protein n=1 Tax=Mortierella polycephala TaxID=41804 RepID=A0A9P6PUG3_9FUNG|nr:hypothetical protein BG011_006101 [Mortierella polycephala]
MESSSREVATASSEKEYDRNHNHNHVDEQEPEQEQGQEHVTDQGPGKEADTGTGSGQDKLARSKLQSQRNRARRVVNRLKHIAKGIRKAHPSLFGGGKADRKARMIIKRREAYNAEWIEKTITQQLYLNTVAPSDGPMQQIPQYTKSARRTVEQDQDMSEPTIADEEEDDLDLEKILIQQQQQPNQVRYADECTSCVMQGLACSGHKPICSQCYYSSAKATASFSRNVTGSLLSSSKQPKPLPSSCSYPIEATPLIPERVYKALAGQTREWQEDTRKDRLNKRSMAKAIQEMTMVKDTDQDAGWMLPHGMPPRMDRNPAAMVDYRLKSRSLENQRIKRQLKAGKLPSGELEEFARIFGNGEEPEPDATKRRKLGPHASGDWGVADQGTITNKGGEPSESSLGTKKTWIERRLLLGDDDLDLDNMGSETPKTDRRKSERRFKTMDAFGFTADDSLIRVGDGADVRAENELSDYLSLNPVAWETFKEMNARVHFNDISKKTVKDIKRTLALGSAMVREEQESEEENGREREEDEEGEGEGEENARRHQVELSKPEIVEVDLGDVKVRRKIKTQKRFIGAKRKHISGDPQTGTDAPEYMEQISETFRPWIAKEDETILPSSCDIPETSFLQAIHFYTSYYYTHINPCPDVFEAMDLTSHIAMGMLVQEVIADFAFKMGKTSQLEDIEVKKEKMSFARNETEWKKAAAAKMRQENIRRGSNVNDNDIDLRSRGSSDSGQHDIAQGLAALRKSQTSKNVSFRKLVNSYTAKDDATVGISSPSEDEQQPDRRTSDPLDPQMDEHQIQGELSGASDDDENSDKDQGDSIDQDDFLGDDGNIHVLGAEALSPFLTTSDSMELGTKAGHFVVKDDVKNISDDEDELVGSVDGDDEFADALDQYDVYEEQSQSVVTTLSNTRLGAMFGRGGDMDEVDESESSDQGEGIISQVVLDDSSSDDDGNIGGGSDEDDAEE